VNKNILAIKH